MTEALTTAQGPKCKQKLQYDLGIPGRVKGFCYFSHCCNKCFTVATLRSKVFFGFTARKVGKQERLLYGRESLGGGLLPSHISRSEKQSVWVGKAAGYNLQGLFPVCTF